MGAGGVADGLATWRLLRSMRRASRRPLTTLRTAQDARLRALVRHAYEKVPLYRALWDEAGFHPDAVRGVRDLARIPPLPKERLKAARPEEVVARGVDPTRCATVATSGSTGRPLRIHLGPAEVRWQRATAWRILFEHGYRWTDRTLEIRKTVGSSFRVQRLGVAAKEWLSLLDPPASWARRLVAGRHEVVVAGAGTLAALAEALEDLGAAPPHPRIVISDSETLSPPVRRRIARALGTEPVDVYGLVELSNFAWECERRDGLHVSADTHLVEVDAAPGMPGPLVVTDLGMWTSPMLRYQTGDFAEWTTTPCPCGRSFPRLARIHGRAVDSVRLADGRRLFWPVFHEVLGALHDLEQWRIVQETPAGLRLELVAPEADEALVDRAAREVRRLLPPEVALVVERLDRIPAAPGEKTRMILSRLGDAA